MHLSVLLTKVLQGRALNTPESVFLELASTCNLSCKGCPVPTHEFRRSRSHKFMDPQSVEKLLALTGKKCETFVINIWGESFLNKNFFPIIELLKTRKVIISTNLNVQTGQVEKLIEYHRNNQNIQELIISMDGWDKESYETYYRVGGSFELIEANLRLLQDSTLAGYVILQFLDDGTIETFEKEANAFADRLGMRSQISRMDMNFKKDGHYDSLGKSCHMLYTGLYIDSDFRILSCCSDPMGELKNGSVLDAKNFRELWNSKTLRQRRVALATDKNRFSVCRQCDGMQI